MPCFICARVQEDPPKGGPSPWARGVVAGEQVLVCPVCQREHPEWAERAERCPACDAVKLSLQVGFRVCRACGHSWSVAEEPLW